MHDEDLVLKSLLAKALVSPSKTSVDSTLPGKNENKFNEEHFDSQRQFQEDDDEDVWRPW